MKPRDILFVIACVVLLRAAVTIGPSALYWFRSPSAKQECDGIRPGEPAESVVTRVLSRYEPMDQALVGQSFSFGRVDGSCVVELDTNRRVVRAQFYSSQMLIP